MTPRFRMLRHIAVASGLLFSLASQHAIAADGEKITIMVGGITKLIYLPARLTEQLGYFKDEGLDVELLSQPAGVDAENELLAGAVQAVVGFYDHTIDLQTKGKDVKAIVVFEPDEKDALFASGEYQRAWNENMCADTDKILDRRLLGH